jgi:hypothetical protein
MIPSFVVPYACPFDVRPLERHAAQTLGAAPSPVRAHLRPERFRHSLTMRIPAMGIRNSSASSTPDPPSGETPKILSIKSITFPSSVSWPVTSPFKKSPGQNH